MAISHVCNSCGVDLAGVDPFIDSSLNLPIVVCPTCDHAVVRRRHPIQTFWRKARRADASLSILLVQIILAAALLGSIGGMITELAVMATGREESVMAFVIGAFGEQEPVTRYGNRPVYNDDGRDAAVIVTAVFSAIAGIWLTATFAHLRFASRWVVWIALLLGVVSLNWVGWAYRSGIALAIGEPTLASSPDAGLWWTRVTLLAGCVAVMLLASPIGLPARWILGLMRGSMWRRQLRRARYSRGQTEQ